MAVFPPLPIKESKEVITLPCKLFCAFLVCNEEKGMQTIPPSIPINLQASAPLFAFLPQCSSTKIMHLVMHNYICLILVLSAHPLPVKQMHNYASEEAWLLSFMCAYWIVS